MCHTSIQLTLLTWQLASLYQVLPNVKWVMLMLIILSHNLRVNPKKVEENTFLFKMCTITLIFFHQRVLFYVLLQCAFFNFMLNKFIPISFAFILFISYCSFYNVTVLITAVTCILLSFFFLCYAFWALISKRVACYSVIQSILTTLKLSEMVELLSLRSNMWGNRA